MALVPRESTGRALVVSREAGVIAGLQTGHVLVDEMDSDEVMVIIGDGGTSVDDVLVAILTTTERPQDRHCIYKG